MHFATEKVVAEGIHHLAMFRAHPGSSLNV